MLGERIDESRVRSTVVWFEYGYAEGQSATALPLQKTSRLGTVAVSRAMLPAQAFNVAGHTRFLARIIDQSVAAVDRE